LQTVLQQVNAVPGTIGSMVCNDEGRPVAHLFPPAVDRAVLEVAAKILADSPFTMAEDDGSSELIDIRYNDARIIVKPLTASYILLLCTKSINLKLLSMALDAADKKLEKHLRETIRPDAPVFAPAAVPQPAMLPPTIRTTDKGILLQVEVMNYSAATYWENMLDVVAVTRGTALEISNFFRAGAFKKLKLTNPDNGRIRHLPVKIIADDKDRCYDGKAFISLSLAEKLETTTGGQLLVQLNIGGGLFGWEGI
jgi:predicted regulator of Ras-like GTPase activity (Roadblock/LC7/MglB family)